MATILEGSAQLTEAESRIINELVRQLRDVHPPRNGGLWAKWSPLAFGLVLAVFGAALNANLNAAREDQRTANERIATIEGRSRDNAIAVERIDRDRAARIAQIDSKLDTVERRSSPMDAILKDVARLEAASANHEQRLTVGREERVSDIARIVDGMNVQKTEIALLRQEMQQLRHAIEARSREPSGPIGGSEAPGDAWPSEHSSWVQREGR